MHSRYQFIFENGYEYEHPNIDEALGIVKQYEEHRNYGNVVACYEMRFTSTGYCVGMKKIF